MKREIQVEYKNVDKLIPYANNPRNNDNAVEAVANSIKEFGFGSPIIIDEKGEIINGHTRLKAAKFLELKEVPTVTIYWLTEEQKKAYRLADNKTGELADWDWDKLSVELETLKDMDFDFEMSDFGFDFNLGEEDLDDAVEDDYEVEVPEEPKSKYGEVYQLGKHRLMCGDSTSINDVEKLMNGNKADMVFTDPPYGMNAVSKSGVLSKKYKTDIIGDDDNSIAIKAYELCQRLFKTSNQVWWGANYYTECLPSSECWIVWDKNNGQSDQTDCELAWANFRSVVRQFTLSSEKINRVHPTQKPVKLFEWIIKRFDKEETFKTVLDLFGGSGSTLIACEQLDRTCYMMELDPKYVDVIINRWEEFTGKKAKLIEENIK